MLIKKIAAFLVIILFAAAFPAKAGADASRVLWSWQDQDSRSRPGFAEKRENGGLLLARPSVENPSVVEIDPQGKIIWQLDGIAANSVQKLANGNYLIADSGAAGRPLFPRVAEFTPGGQVAWEYDFSSRSSAPLQAVRLKSGNTLIVTAAAVLEVNPEKKTVWSYRQGLWYASFAERLANGNTLIVDRGVVAGGRVIEVDSKGNVVWEYNQGLVKPVSAARLDNGDTLIADIGKSWKIEVTPDNKLVKAVSWHQVLAVLGISGERFARPLAGGGTLLTAGSRAMVVDDNSVRVYLDGNWLNVPLTPIIVGEKILIPVRALSDALGWQLNWQPANKLLTVSDGSRTVEMLQDSTAAKDNDLPVQLDIAPRLVDNTLMVPVRFLADTFGLGLKWDDGKRILQLFSPGNLP